MKKSLIALAFGTLGLGIAEFVMMGILPDVAKDLGISIPTAGHFISAYALGVCVGAPVLTLARKYPLKHILLVLVTVIMIGNICAAMAPNYPHDEQHKPEFDAVIQRTSEQSVFEYPKIGHQIEELGAVVGQSDAGGYGNENSHEK